MASKLSAMFVSLARRYSDGLLRVDTGCTIKLNIGEGKAFQLSCVEYWSGMGDLSTSGVTIRYVLSFHIAFSRSIYAGMQ